MPKKGGAPLNEVFRGMLDGRLKEIDSGSGPAQTRARQEAEDYMQAWMIENRLNTKPDEQQLCLDKIRHALTRRADHPRPNAARDCLNATYVAIATLGLPPPPQLPAKILRMAPASPSTSDEDDSDSDIDDPIMPNKMSDD